MLPHQWEIFGDLLKNAISCSNFEIMSKVRGVALKCRLDELQAAILGVKLRHLPNWNIKRQDLAQRYLEGLQRRSLPLQTQRFCPRAAPARHLFVIKVPRDLRDLLVQRLAERGVQALVHYPVPLYRQEAFVHLQKEENPSAEELCASVISLPFHPYLDLQDIDYVLESLQGGL